jgi:hypothetical protein
VLRILKPPPRRGRPGQQAVRQEREPAPADGAAPSDAHLRERIREHEQAAARLRQIAYWVVLGFGTLAAFLIVASQVSGIGQLPGFALAEEHRLALSFATGTIALLTIALAIRSVVLATPDEEVSLSRIEADETNLRLALMQTRSDTERAQIQRRMETDELRFIEDSELLGRYTRYNRISSFLAEYWGLQNRLQSETEPENRRELEARLDALDATRALIINGLRAHAMHRRFRGLTTRLLVAALVAGISLLVFAWAANPRRSFLRPHDGHRIDVVTPKCRDAPLGRLVDFGLFSWRL